MYQFELKDPHFLPHLSCDVHLSLDPARGLLLIGENGVGKSTLISRLYQGLDKSLKGILIDQKNLDFFYDRKLGDIKRILLKAATSNMDVSFFQDAWEKFGLSLKEDRLVSTLSGGESQSLKICGALLHQADIYFFDEPSQSLDEARKVVLANVIKKLILSKVAVLIVEHDQSWIPEKMQVIQLENNHGALVQRPL